MFLLIPTEQKNKLVKQYRLRLVFLVLGLLVVLLGLGSFSLLPAYYSILEDEKVITGQVSELEKSIADKSGEDFEKSLRILKENLKVLKGEDRDITSIINFINSKVSEAVTLTKFNYKHNIETASVLEVGGMAKDRGSLLLFSKDLKGNESFSTVDLPISNLAKETNIDFIITITGDF